MKIILFTIIYMLSQVGLAQDMLEEIGYCPPNILIGRGDRLMAIVTEDKDLSELNRLSGLELIRSISVEFKGLNEHEIDSLLPFIQNRSKIYFISFKKCPIKKLPDSLEHYFNLLSLEFINCNLLDSLFLNMNKFYNENFSLIFRNCHLKTLPKGIDKLSCFLHLQFINTDDYDGLNLEKELKRFVRKNNISELGIINKNLSVFPEVIFELSAIKRLLIRKTNIKEIPDKFEKLPTLMYFISDFEKNMLPQSVLKHESILFLYGKIDNREYCRIRLNR